MEQSIKLLINPLNSANFCQKAGQEAQDAVYVDTNSTYLYATKFSFTYI